MSRFRFTMLAALAAALAPPGAASAAASAATLPLESYRFPGVYWTQTANGGTERRVAEFTPLGPIEGTIRENPPRTRGGESPLPLRPTHVAVDPRGPTHYGRINHGLVSEFDRLTGELTDIPRIGPDVLSWPTGLTFDTARNRLVVSTLGGQGYLFAYSPHLEVWSLLRDLDNRDIHSLTYSAGEDAFFALTAERQGPALLRYDALGLPAGSIALSLPPVARGEMFDYQLIATNDRLALLTPLLPDPANPTGPKVQFSYLIDPDTGATEAFGPVRVVPEPTAAALFAAFAGVTRLRRRASR